MGEIFSSMIQEHGEGRRQHMDCYGLYDAVRSYLLESPEDDALVFLNEAAVHGAGMPQYSYYAIMWLSFVRHSRSRGWSHLQPGRGSQPGTRPALILAARQWRSRRNCLLPWAKPTHESSQKRQYSHNLTIRIYSVHENECIAHNDSYVMCWPHILIMGNEKSEADERAIYKREASTQNRFKISHSFGVAV